MKLPQVFFMFSVLGLAFGYGVAVGVYEVFPYKSLAYSLNSLETLIAERDNVTGHKPTGFLAPRRYEGNQVTVFEQAQTQPGFTLLSGFFDDLPELRLIKPNGSVIQRWPVSYLSLFEESDHILPASDIPATDWNAAIHGMEILRDGSIVFNFDGKGTVKLDRCGKTLWTVPEMTHHSVDLSADNGFWVPSRHYRETDALFPLFSTPFRDDTLMHISSDGKILLEKSLNDILIKNGLYSLLVANGRFEANMQEEDVLHVNDIEELKESQAAAYEYFSAGDLLVSSRHLNLLMVIDPSTWIIKWHQTGPWLRQHDPDFQADGSITVFNNNSDDTKRGTKFKGSQIMAVQPFSPTRTVQVLYGNPENEKFFTNTQGKHQRLTNGNMLITEYYGGRVLEINPQREIVWEYINQYDEENVAKISGAKRYPPDYFEVSDWSCSTNQEAGLNSADH